MDQDAVDDVIPLMESSGYRVEELLGSGNFGRVYLCTRSDTLESVAVKAIPKKDAEYVKDEVHNLELLRDLDPDKNGLIRFNGYLELHGNVFLEFEKLDMTLYDLVMTYNRPLLLSEIQAITLQMLMALEALRGIKMVHTDIKVDNIMLTEAGQRPLQAKLIDFGLAQDVSKLVLGEVLQALPYRAPEVILGLPLSGAMDMWALGTVIGSVYMEAELYSGDCELANMNDIVQLLGRPQNHLLETGLYTKKYFDRDDADLTWKLKTECTCSVQNCSAGSGFCSERCAVHPLVPDMMTEIARLEDIALTRPGTSANEDTRTFLGLLREMLRLDPETRILPSAALQHPFIQIKDFPSDSVSSDGQTPANTVGLASSGDDPLCRASLSNRDKTSKNVSPANSSEGFFATTQLVNCPDKTQEGSSGDWDQSLYVTSFSNSDRQSDTAYSDDSNLLRASSANRGDRALQHTSVGRDSLASYNHGQAIDVDCNRTRFESESDNRSSATGRSDQIGQFAESGNGPTAEVSHSCNDAEWSQKSSSNVATQLARASSTDSDDRSPQREIPDKRPSGLGLQIQNETIDENGQPHKPGLASFLSTADDGPPPTKCEEHTALVLGLVWVDQTSGDSSSTDSRPNTTAHLVGRIREFFSALMDRICRLILSVIMPPCNC